MKLKMQSEPSFKLKVNSAIVSKSTTDYNDLENKPSINGIELVGNVEITSVSEDAKNISANASSISNLKEEVSKKASQTELDTLSTTVKTNTKSIETNTSDIATNKASIETNATNIATNTKNISSNTSDINILTTTVLTKAEQSDLDTTNKNVATNTSAIATETTARESADTTLQANIDTLSSKVDTKQDTLVSGTNIKTINNQSLLGSGNITIEGGGGSASTEPFYIYQAYYTDDYSKDSNIPLGYVNIYTADGRTLYIAVSSNDILGMFIEEDFEYKTAGSVYGFQNLPSLDECSAYDCYTVYSNLNVDMSTGSISFIDSSKAPIMLMCIAIKTDYGNFWLALRTSQTYSPYKVGKLTNITVSATPSTTSYQAWDTKQQYGYVAKIEVGQLKTKDDVISIQATDTIEESIAVNHCKCANGYLYLYAKTADKLEGTIYKLNILKKNA